jgi:hypothetical protein
MGTADLFDSHEVLSAAVVRGWRADLATWPFVGSQPADDAPGAAPSGASDAWAGGGSGDASREETDRGRWELIRELEKLKSTAAAVQAVLSVELEASLRAGQEEAGVDARDVGRGVAAQVALARRDSPAKGARHLGLARALVGELPHTLEALTAGCTSEWRATLIARETACLSVEDRRTVDAELAAAPGGIAALGDRGAQTAARAIAYRLDPYAATRRAATAESQRRVSLRPAPETMSILSGLLPVRQGVAVYATLTRHADSLRATGDPRTRSQIMADTLVERLTGQATADAVPIEVQLVITDHTLLATHTHSRTRPRTRTQDDTEAGVEADTETGVETRAATGAAATAVAGEVPAYLAGYGPDPAPLARSWIRDTTAQVWLRRLFTTPQGRLVAMESRRRRFTGQLRSYLIARDQVCRTPWCDAPIRHADHAVPAARGGPTTTDNGQGLCEACNHTKQAPGWTTTTHGDTIHTTTPTSRHRTRPPQTVPGTPPAPPPRPPSRIEYLFRDYLLSA